MNFPPPYYRWRPHPWHGLEIGPEPPQVVTAFIEITPFDSIKYELDKTTGYVRVDRPQRTSSQPPTLYGIIPRTYAGRRVGNLMDQASGGDGDPLDICVVSERPISRGEVLLDARIIGGLPMIDGGFADDKIIAVLVNDQFWGGVDDLDQIPAAIVERLRHYFITYKMRPGEEASVQILEPYGREHAWTVVDAARADYDEMFGE